MDTEKSFKAQLKELRTGILEMQDYLKNERISTLIIVTGFDGAGKGHIIHKFNEWLDPRTVSTTAFWHQSEEERERPYFWKFWNYLPSKGRTALFFGSWYADLIAQKLCDGLPTETMENRIEKIRFFERMLAADGVLILKFWLHLSREEQLSKRSELEKNPQFHWKMQSVDWSQEGHYDRFWETSRMVIEKTDQACSRWIQVPAFDPDQRDFLVAKAFVHNVQHFNTELHKLRKSPAPSLPSLPVIQMNSEAISANPTPIPTPSLADLSPIPMDKMAYKELLPELQDQLFELAWKFFDQKRSVFLIFEGWDAAGKGGCIRRVVESIDARLFDVIPISAPSKQELSHHYLWRFWKSIPRAGRMAIYDRSWYGRVLVERVEGFASPHEWQRAYNEIIDFENQLIRPGHLVLKFWLEISPETQLKRFEKRQVIPFKRFKLGPEDWRNRSKWSTYQVAASEMIEKTQTQMCPWHVVQADNKRATRIEVLKTIVQSMSQAASHGKAHSSGRSA